MSALPRSPVALSLETAIDRNLLTVMPQTLVLEAIAQMYQHHDRCAVWESPQKASESSELEEIELDPQIETTNITCLLVVDGKKLVGLLTERDLVRLAAMGMNLSNVTIAEVMTQRVITAKKSELHDVFRILNLFREHHIRHLPIVNHADRLVGMLSLEGIREALQAAYILKLRRVAEVMTTEVVHALPSASVQDVAQLMSEHRVSSVVICESEPASDRRIPVGMIAERDIVQFQTLQLNLATVSAQMVMSTPLWSVGPEDSLWIVHEKMHSLRIRHLVVCEPSNTIASRLLGIVTQNTIIQVLEPSEMFNTIHLLQQKVSAMEQEKTYLLNHCKTFLDQQVNERTAQIQKTCRYQQLLGTVAQKIRQSLNLEEILTTTVKEVRELLNCDRVSIYRCDPVGTCDRVAESVDRDCLCPLVSTISDVCVLFNVGSENSDDSIRAIADIDSAGLNQLEIKAWEELGFRSFLQVPIAQSGHKDNDLPEHPDRTDRQPKASHSPHVWGFLIAGQCQGTKQWQLSHIKLLKQLATQLTIAIEQSTLLQRMQAELVERQEAENALAQEHNFLSAILDTIGALVIILDCQGRILKFNQACEQITGYGLDEAIGRYLWDLLILPEEVIAVQGIFHSLKPGQFQDRYQHYWLTKDSSRRLISWSTTCLSHKPDRVDYAIVTGIDITERDRAEISLQNLLKRYSTLIKVAPVGIFLTNLEGECVYVNENWLQIAGLTATEALGTGWFKAIHPDDRPELFKTWQEAVANREIFRLEYRFQRRDGCITWVFGQAVLDIDREQNAIGYLGTITDITQRKQAEAALTQLNEELEIRVEQRTTALQTLNQELQKEIRDRQQAESELKQLLAAVEAASDGIAILNQEKYRYLNQAHVELFGYDRSEEFLGKTWKNFYPLDEQERLQRNIFQILKQQKYWRGEAIAQRKDGSEFTEELSLTLTDNGELICVCRNIDERKQMETALRSSEVRFRATFEQAAVGIALFNLQGKFFKFNQKFREIFGYRNEELFKKSVFDLTYPDDLHKTRELLQALLQGKMETFSLAKRCIRKNGTLVWIDVTVSLVVESSGKPGYFLSVVQDISDRHASEAKLQQVLKELAYHKQALDEFAIVTITDPNGVITYVNDKFCEISGYSRTEAIGQTHRIVNSGYHPKSFFQELWSTISSGEIWQNQVKNKAKNGEYYWVDTTIIPFLNDRGEPFQYLAIRIDVTERKQAEALIQASLTEKEVLLKEIHHRVKNNLQVISSLLDLQSDYIQDPDLLSQFEDSQSRIQSMALIHEKLYQSNNLSSINFADYVESLIEHLFLSYRCQTARINPILKIVNISLNLDTAIPCGLIINELVSNALKHGFPNGAQGEILVEIYPVSDSARFVLAIADNGIGFPPDVKFDRVESSLGLQLVCTLTQQLRGKIELDRSHGTQFTLTLSQIKKIKQ